MVLLSFKRPQNMDRIVRTCLAARFVGKVVVSNNNPEVDLREWLTIESDRLQLIRQPRPTPPGSRLAIARETGGQYFISIDDDAFLAPGQLDRLYRALLADPHAPHGFQGQNWERSGGGELGGAIRSEGRVDVLNRAYLFTEAQLAECERLGAALDLGPLDAIRNGEDILLSCSGSARPYVHDVGPVLECATSNDAGIAVWRSIGFEAPRIELYRRLRELKPLDPA